VCFLMQRITKNPQPVPHAKWGRHNPLKVVFIYDGIADLLHAYDTWARLAARFKHEFQIVTSAWNFNMLRDPRLRQKAVMRSADADVIVLSASARHELPDHVRNWIRSWLPWKQGTGNALVAMLQENPLGSATAARFRDYLREKAQQAGMDFFCNREDSQPHWMQAAAKA